MLKGLKVLCVNSNLDLNTNLDSFFETKIILFANSEIVLLYYDMSLEDRLDCSLPVPKSMYKKIGPSHILINLKVTNP